MSDNKHKHLDYIQNVVDRMARNSFMLKGWAVTLVSAIFAFATAQEVVNKVVFIAIAMVPVVMFWIMDGYFLWQERMFRGLYDEVRQIDKEASINYGMNPYKYRGGENTWWNSIISITLRIFYGILLVIVLIMMMLFSLEIV